MSERAIKYLCEDLFDKGKNSVLLYGKPELTSHVLKTIYEIAREKPEFLCSFHDASQITNPMEFYEPILRLKYGDEYDLLKEEKWFKTMISKHEGRGVFELAALCRKETKSKNPNHRKLPVIFIDGIEQLFFNMDYDINNTNDWDKGFGNNLRGELHQENSAVFYGTVRNANGIEFAKTLGRYDYLFYAENFMQYPVE
jgi:hypothetical protein